jgi:hypothetical protein
MTDKYMSYLSEQWESLSKRFGSRAILDEESKFSQYSVVKNFVVVVLLFAALILLSYPLLRSSDLGLYFLALYALVFIGISKAFILEWFKKLSKLQVERPAINYVAVSTLNTFLGLAVPIAMLNIALNILMTALELMPNRGTIWCAMRMDLVHIFHRSAISWYLSEVFWILIIGLIAYYLVAGFVQQRAAKK